MRKYVLKKPIVLGSEVPVTELNFREEVCAGDMRDIDMTELKKPGPNLKIAARLCGMTDAEMDKLSVPDMFAVIGLVQGFLSAGLEMPTT